MQDKFYQEWTGTEKPKINKPQGNDRCNLHHFPTHLLGS